MAYSLFLLLLLLLLLLLMMMVTQTTKDLYQNTLNTYLRIFYIIHSFLLMIIKDARNT